MSGTDWDYTQLAGSYWGRPGYARSAIDWMVEVVDAATGSRCCDIGAGTGHLTMPLLESGLLVDAVEPNTSMRDIGIERSASSSGVRWFAATAEQTELTDNAYALVTFGSSLNVTHVDLALTEAARILEPGGWMACMWNHRDLTDPLQGEIEALIHDRVPDYQYGARRANPTQAIESSGLFASASAFVATQDHTVSVDRWLEAWRSHATLARQAGAQFASVVDDIQRLVGSRVVTAEISVPYSTVAWAARVTKELP